jgi:hypothetical protein
MLNIEKEAYPNFIANGFISRLKMEAVIKTGN